MARFGLELHKKSGNIFVGTGTSNPEGKKYIDQRVISCNGSTSSPEAIMKAFELTTNTSERISLILEKGKVIDIYPQGILGRFKNWFDGIQEGETYEKKIPAIDDPNFRTTMGYNPKTGKIQFGHTLRSSALRRIFDL